MTVDTLSPDPNNGQSSIGYTGIASGGWAKGSAYNMYSAIQSADSSGYFSGGGSIASISNTYTPTLASPGNQEHVFLHLTDGADGASATSNYYVNFHAPIENKVPKAGYPYTYTRPYPSTIPVGTNSPTYLDWQYLAVYSGGAGGLSTTIGQSKTVSLQDQISASISLTKGWISSIFGASATNTATQELSASTTVNVPANVTEVIYYGGSGISNGGTCDDYFTSGYAGQGTYEQTTWYQNGVPSVEPVVISQN